MFSTADEVLKFIKKEDVKFVDVRFCDLPGVMQHFNVPAEGLPEEFFTEGQMFDGSSIRGFQAIHESDMKLIPDLGSAYLDPFRAEKTLIINMSIRDPFTDEPYSRDPRNVALKAEAYLKSTGIAIQASSNTMPKLSLALMFTRAKHDLEQLAQAELQPQTEHQKDHPSASLAPI